MQLSADFEANRQEIRNESIEMGSMGQESPVMHMMAEGSYNPEGLAALSNSMIDENSADKMYNLVISSDLMDQKNNSAFDKSQKPYMRISQDSIREQEDELIDEDECI